MGRVYKEKNVLEAARERINLTLDNTEKHYVAYSGGKDSTVLLHLVVEEALKRGRKTGVMFIDMEAQYSDTINHAEQLFEDYKDDIDLHWICIPLRLRNALTNYEPQWVCWNEEQRDIWVREKPVNAKGLNDYPFAVPELEFEELIVLFGEWYGGGEKTAAFIGIRAEESLHRYCAIATWQKKNLTLNGWRWTTKIIDQVYNTYPIYDWLTADIWKYHSIYPHKKHNPIYDKMQMAGVPLKNQRLCQPFGDDQRRGLWLYHILEPETWPKLIARVNGANSGALYIQESGNITGYNKIKKPDGHTWQSFCNLLLQTLPPHMQKHYRTRFKKFISGWKQRGYDRIPEEAPPELEAKCWAPSWRRMCKVLLRNDYWCKGLGQGQPKSDAWQRFKEIKKAEKQKTDMFIEPPPKAEQMDML